MFLCGPCTCGACFSRAVIGITNGVILALSIICIAILYVKRADVDFTAVFNLFSSNLPFVYLVVVAIMLAVSSVFGFFLICCVAKCWRYSYLICVCVILILEGAGVGVAYTQGAKLLDSVEGAWYKNNGTQSEPAKIFENISHCCTYRDNQSQIIERVEQYNYTCGDPLLNINFNYKNTTSCLVKIQEDTDKAMKTLKVVGVILLAFQALVLICALYLACCYDPDQIEKDNSITYVN